MLTQAGVLLFALAGAAAAAWIIYSGVGGTTHGTIVTGTSSSAITIADDPEYVQFYVEPGVTNRGTDVLITNNDPNFAHTIQTITGTFHSNPTSCASHLSYQWETPPNPIGATLPAGATQTFGIKYLGDVNMPAECSGATWTVDWTGTTSP